MILRNFRGLDAKCLHPKPSLRKIREADGDNLGLRILREEVACYSDSEEARKHKGTLEKEEEGGERRVQEGTVGPTTKTALELSAGNQSGQGWKVMGEKRRQRENPHSSEGV